MILNLHLIALVFCGMGIFFALATKSALWLIYFVLLVIANVWLVNRRIQ